MTREERQQILTFLREPVPPTGWQDLFPKWRERARNQGSEAPSVFLEMLREGRFDEQYASLLALREYGYEAWGTGSGAEFLYQVRAPGAEEAQVIRPVHPDDKGFRSKDGQWIENDEN
jgi:hypothetical protein